jgi:phosphate transport system substrate-binding protein
MPHRWKMCRNEASGTKYREEPSMKKAIVMTMIVAVCLLGFLTSGNAQSPAAQTPIRVKGSDDMASRIDKLAKVYMKDRSGVTILVSGGSRGAGLSDLLDKNCEVVMTGHHLSNEDKQAAREKGIDLAERLVGHGGLIFLTYPQNTVDEVTVEQLQKLLKGDYSSWNQVGGPPDPVVVISLEAVNSDTRMFLLHDLLGVPSLKSKVELMMSFGGILRKVAETKGALGFCRMRDLESQSRDSEGAKALKIKEKADSPAVAPSRSTIADATYPIKRPFYLCFDSKANPDVKQFVDFVVSKGWGGDKQ